MLKILLIVGLTLLLIALLIPRPVVSDYEPVDVIVPEPIPEKPDIKTYSATKVREVFGDGQWVYFNNIVMHESRWNPTAQNPHSTAYGIGQFLNGTWGTVGCTKTSDPYIQVDCMIKYIKQHPLYGDPHRAWHYWEVNRHY